MVFSSYEERNRSLEIVSSRHKESNTFEEFMSRVYAPITRNLGIIGSNLGIASSVGGSNSVGSVGHTQLAAALIDHHPHQSSIKLRERELTQHTITLSSATTTTSSSVVSDHPSPRPSRKLHHPFKTGTGVKKSSSVGAANISPVVMSSSTSSAGMMMTMTSPPESPVLQAQMRRFK